VCHADDAASAIRNERVGVVAESAGVVGRKVSHPHDLVGRQDKTTAFLGDVSHRGVMAIATVSRWRTVNFDALVIHCHPGRRHQILPAQHCPQFADGGVVHVHGRTVPEAPYQAFSSGGHQLATFAKQPSFR
jgi:hypothetical protein